MAGKSRNELTWTDMDWSVETGHGMAGSAGHDEDPAGYGLSRQDWDGQGVVGIGRHGWTRNGSARTDMISGRRGSDWQA
jgi:hypothetical protein